MPLDWNENLTDDIAAPLVGALNELDGRIVGRAQSELYPGHGKLTGTLQRALQFTQAERQGDKVVGSVGVGKEASAYALVQHRRYRYLLIGLEFVQPQALDIVRRYITGGQ